MKLDESHLIKYYARSAHGSPALILHLAVEQDGLTRDVSGSVYPTSDRDGARCTAPAAQRLGFESMNGQLLIIRTAIRSYSNFYRVKLHHHFGRWNCVEIHSAADIEDSPALIVPFPGSDKRRFDNVTNVAEFAFKGGGQPSRRQDE